ncbi:hypothetical protein Hanom_Chr14g01328291 [Helianthus anomalus]
MIILIIHLPTLESRNLKYIFRLMYIQQSQKSNHYVCFLSSQSISNKSHELQKEKSTHTHTLSELNYLHIR